MRLLFALLLLAPTALAQSFPTMRQAGSVITEAGPVAVELVADGLERPWGAAFLPDGRLLVTERPGRLNVMALDGTVTQISGTPTVFAEGQGGLLDVALSPDFAETQHVYLSFARPGPGGSAATALGRGALRGDSLAGFETLFTQTPWITGPNHFGSRIAFDAPTPGDGGHVFLTMGERFQFDPAQNLENTLGTVVRLNLDGSVPADNPFVGQANARPEIWSYGHRNVESAAMDPATGELWIVEMGPLGGDELNRIERGANYGWPTVSWGRHYDGSDIPDPDTRPDFEDATRWWSPVISPSGMAFYDGAVFPEWTGSAFVGSLTRQGVVRLRIADGAVTDEEIVPLDARIREVEAGPDGMVYLLTDAADGAVWRLAPLGE